MQTESRSFNQVSVKIQRPMSLPPAWSIIVSTGEHYKWRKEDCLKEDQMTVMISEASKQTR